MSNAVQMKSEVKPLSRREERLFDTFESSINNNLKGFRDVGYALANIRVDGLYRVDYDTFEEYCKERWDISRRRAYYYIGAYEVLENLCTMVHKTDEPEFTILPANERQARPLTEISSEQQCEAWALVLKEADERDCRITASFIHRVTDKFRAKKVKSKLRLITDNDSVEFALPEEVIKPYQKFFGAVQKNRESLTPKGREQLVKILRDILESIES